MQPDLPPPPPPAPPPMVPGVPPIRPPVPGWLWIVFGLGMIPVWMLICLFTSGMQPNDIAQAAMVGLFSGLLSAIPLLGGLALASRFYSGTGARIVAGIVFAVVLVVGLVALLFAGCMCILSLGRFNQSH